MFNPLQFSRTRADPQDSRDPFSPAGQTGVGLPHAMRALLLLTCALVTWPLSGCDKTESVSLTEVFPETDAIAGWAATGSVELFDQENLYDLVDGQAESFFAYGFEEVAVQAYENADRAALDVEVWQLRTPADAFGLFTFSIAGTPVAIGNDGDADPGRRVAFWQNRYFVTARARQNVPDAVLQAFAESVSEALPPGSSDERPALMDRLPATGLVERNAIYFRQEESLQDRLWLGGENRLGLSSETDGVLAPYDVGGATAQLLLVQYASADQASDGLAALREGSVEALLISDTKDRLLGAVFGDSDVTMAVELLAEALQ